MLDHIRLALGEPSKAYQGYAGSELGALRIWSRMPVFATCRKLDSTDHDKKLVKDRGVILFDASNCRTDDATAEPSESMKVVIAGLKGHIHTGQIAKAVEEKRP